MNRTATGAFLAAALIAVGLGCSKHKQQTEATKAETSKAKTPPMMPEKDYMVMGAYLNDQDSLPRIRYYDGEQVSLNDRCAVRKAKLNPKMPPIYVNGRPVGFC